MEINVALFETLAQQRDPIYADLLRATEIVKGFIASRGYIVYGGTAIDYALRLRGSSEYDDSKLTIPDLDFYAPDSAQAAYDLAAILYGAGMSDARAIVAVHSTTMRVDAGSNHWIADISYMCKEAFDRIPTVTYDGMRCTHPDYQRIDLHSSLSFPFDNAPTEVITARWDKDVRRLGKLAEFYPLAAASNAGKSTSTAKPLSLPRREGLPLAGWAAYNAFVAASSAHTGASGDVNAFRIAGNAYIYASPVGKAEYWYDFADDSTKYTHSGYGGVMPSRAETDDTILYSCKDRLLSCVEIPIGGETVYSCCVNAVLMYMMARHIVHGCDAAVRAYVTLWDIAAAPNAPGWLQLSPATYGARNINSAQHIAVARARGEPVAVPKNFVPSRGKDAPGFDYEGPAWVQDGRAL